MREQDPKRVATAGPLAAYRDGFADELASAGYTPGSAEHQVGLMAHLSRWLESRGLGPADLTPERAEEFIRARRAAGYTLLLSQRALAPLLDYLRGLGVVPQPPPAACTAAEKLTGDYRRYLVSERGLAAATVCAYLVTARLFLGQLDRSGGLDLGKLTAAQVRSFAVAQCCRRPVASAKVLVVGLRSLLRFLFLAGHTGQQLAWAVPTPAGFAGGSLPRALEPGAVAALLAGCDRDTAVGRRDFAIITLLARLGLRGGEAAALELDDIDWHHGEIVVHGKGGRRDRLPLPADVGEALVAYLREGRPAVAGCRTLFLRVRAPLGALGTKGVADVVRWACRRAGLPAAGPHRLRHSAATAMLRNGASLTEVGQVLRQDRAATAAIYAKVDRAALRALAQCWPEVAA
jgi:integrase/recombinase XerD